jgi:hypothetical protein
LEKPIAEIAAKMAATAEPLPDVSTVEKNAQPAPAGDTDLIKRHMGALVGRLMSPGGWVAGQRRAGAEPIWTGRIRPYDESTLRKEARLLAQCGMTDIVAGAVEAQVRGAVESSGVKAIAYTDMFDQVYWTKKPAHSGPIGNRNNRLLAATYFGMTFVQPSNGPSLAYCVSWHKPASPLQDALEALHGEDRRATWLSENTLLHIWDRGGSGIPTLRWAAARGIPYLTVSKGSTRWTYYRRVPRLHIRSKLPVFVRPDRKVGRGNLDRGKLTRGTPDLRKLRQGKLRRGKLTRGRLGRGKPKRSIPEEVIFPAHPDKGRTSTKALRYRTGKPLSRYMLRKVDRVYKTRWPGNENPIKTLVAVGFDRNLDRGLTNTTSRGTDGALARVEAREQALIADVAAFTPAAYSETMKAIRGFQRKESALEKERTRISEIPQDKGTRMPTGAETLCKYLMLLMYNVLVLVLMKSPLREVRVMSLPRVFELLLGRSMLASLDQQRTTLWIDPVPSTSERVLQQELVRLFNEQSLTLRGRQLLLRVRDPTEKMPGLRVSG